MKKMIFTAIVMIAFSSASMANTIADEEVEVSEKSKIEIGKVLTVQQTNPCKNNFSLALSQAYQMGYNDAQAWNYASVAYIFCANGLTAPIFIG